MKKMINRIFSPNVTVIIKLNKYKIIEDTSSGRKYLLRFEFSLICLLKRPNSFGKEGVRENGLFVSIGLLRCLKGIKRQATGLPFQRTVALYYLF